jgi:hypothetical protein
MQGYAVARYGIQKICLVQLFLSEIWTATKFKPPKCIMCLVKHCNGIKKKRRFHCAKTWQET